MDVNLTRFHSAIGKHAFQICEKEIFWLRDAIICDFSSPSHALPSSFFS